MKNIIYLVALLFVLVILSSCSGLSGTYKTENGQYTIEFTSSTDCTWYQDGRFFKGTYKKTDGGYQLMIMGSGLYQNTVFIAKIDGKDLRAPLKTAYNCYTFFF